MPSRISLSDQTLDVNIRRCDITRFDFSEIEDYVRALTGDRQYQFEAIQHILCYLWGGAYNSIVDPAKENWPVKSHIQKRFHSREHFLNMLPLPDRLSGVCYMATGTGKSYVMFAVAHLSLLLGKVSRVLILGPSSTVIETGLREKFADHLYGQSGARLKGYLPECLRNRVIRLLTCNDPVEDHSIVIENINAIYSRDSNSIGDTLFYSDKKILVLSDEVHHAYSHLSFSGKQVGFDSGPDSKKSDRQDERLWMKFLREESTIDRHIGFTGTPYNADMYFPDVIFNYSIQDAISEKIIKKINPILRIDSDTGDNGLTDRQRFEQIMMTQADNRRKFAYPDDNGKIQVKPITIFIHQTRPDAQKTAERFIVVLADYMRETLPELADFPRSALEQKARDQVICVITGIDKAQYQQKLHQVEETDPSRIGGAVEYIFAVNKLSEGWDVDNVFQIVPSTQKVFNSKLLIFQVLGRGLRLPRKPSATDFQHAYPTVATTNHERFAQHIMELLDEVIACELRLVSSVLTDAITGRVIHHFNLFNLEYLPSVRIIDREPRQSDDSGTHRPPKLTASPEKLGLKVTYLQGIKRFQLTKDFVTVDQVVFDIERRFRNTVFERSQFDFGDEQTITDIPDRMQIESVIRSAMKSACMVGDRLSLENRQAIDLYFNQFLPKSSKQVIRENISGKVFGIQTRDMPQVSARSSGLTHDLSCFISEDYQTELSDENRFVLQELKTGQVQPNLMEGSTFEGEGFNPGIMRRLIPDKHIFVINPSLFRSPQSLVLLSHEPERRFCFLLAENARLISGWIKSPDRDFYSLDYEYWKGGKDRIRRSFNPDFFIRVVISDYLLRLRKDGLPEAINRLKELQDNGYRELILVVEIKDDADFSDETRAKETYGTAHFHELNSRLRETNEIDVLEPFRESMCHQKYQFFLLRPNGFAEWFSRLRTGAVVDFNG